MSKQFDKWLSKGMQIAVKNNISNKEEYASMYADYMQKSKIADQKMRRLEALSHSEHFKGVLTYAYGRAQKDLQKWNGTDKSHLRFSSNVPTSIQGLASKTLDLERFVDSQTSTKTGIIQVYTKRVQTINQKYGRDAQGNIIEGWKDLRWQDLANYYEKEKNKNLDSKMGSATQMRALGHIKRLETKDKEKQAQKIQEVINGSVKVTNDGVLNAKIQSLLKSGVKPEDLFT